MTQHALGFEVLYEYDAAEPGITVPIILSVGQSNADLMAKLDTGASCCVFEREVGEYLGLDIEKGISERIWTPMGSFAAYGHSVTLSAFGFQFDVIVYFSSMPKLNRNVLGRHGWMQQLKIGIVDYEGRLYVGRYDDAE